jgi:hypothetical protein
MPVKVVVELWNGLVESVSSNAPGVQVIIKEYDKYQDSSNAHVKEFEGDEFYFHCPKTNFDPMYVDRIFKVSDQKGIEL